MISIRFILVVLCVGTFLGFTSTYAVVTSNWRPGRVTSGAWAIWPQEGARDADPYTRAAIARAGDLPLGLGEGLTFRADHDDSGQRLSGNCTYRLEGTLPVARIWTLTLITASGQLHANPAVRYGFTSAEVLRQPNGNLDVAISADAMSGDWLPAPPRQNFQLLLKLYDTPIAAVSGAIRGDRLPALKREGCI